MNNTLLRFVPAVITAVLLTAMLVNKAAGEFGVAPEAEAYFDRVKATITGVSRQSGPWIGVDAQPTPAAVELLQPNEILQRRYTNPDTGEWFELLIVHCKDVRDMVGHYPPVCYPAHGWDQQSRTTMPIPRPELTATDYLFSKNADFNDRSIRIANVFVLPTTSGEDGVTDFAEVEQAGLFRNRSRLGSAQIQVITPADMPQERREQVVGVAFRLAEPVMRDVERGPA